MKLISNICSSLSPEFSGDSKHREGQLSIDGSVRFQLLGLIKSAIFWLVVSILFGLIASIKLHSPGFLGHCEWLTYGKVEPVFWNSLIYGWLFNAGLACSFWLLVRLGGAPAGNGFLLTVSLSIWNVALIVGLLGILMGGMLPITWRDSFTVSGQLPYEWLEMPAFIVPVLLAAFLGMGLWGVLAFRERVHRVVYASQWYILAALFAFAWIYTVVQVMLMSQPAQGTLQYLIGSWYANNLLMVVIVPFALAVVYYMLPKVLGKPIVGYNHSGKAFWSWILFASSAGSAELLYGPVPSWVSSVGIIAAFGILYPLSIFSIQFLSTLFASFSRIWETISLRFIFFGCIGFLLFGCYFIYGSLRVTQDVVQFSSFNNGVQLLGLLGFATMVFSGCLYFILSRLLNKELPSAGLAELHFWMQLLGVFLVVSSLITGGMQEGELMNGSVTGVLSIVANMKSYYAMATLGMGLILVGAIGFMISFSMLLLSERSGKETTVNLIEESPDLEVSAT